MRNLPRNNTDRSGIEAPDAAVLYSLAEESGVAVYWFALKAELESLSVELSPGVTAVAIDPGKLQGQRDEKLKLAHELGHCLTGAMYEKDSPPDERNRCECRARRWTYEHLLPYQTLCRALRSGRRDPAELAEFFDVPQQLVVDAAAYYTGPKGLALP